jgi:hypothetical protein
MKHLLIADEPCEFFEMICLCVTDAALCSKLGNQARALAETEYNRDVLIRKMVAFYEQLPG